MWLYLNRTQCFCGDADLLPSDKRPETDCNYKCSGDVTKLCGAGFRNTVYSTGISGVGKTNMCPYLFKVKAMTNINLFTS